MTASAVKNLSSLELAVFQSCFRLAEPAPRHRELTGTRSGRCARVGSLDNIANAKFARRWLLRHLLDLAEIAAVWGAADASGRLNSWGHTRPTANLIYRLRAKQEP